MQKAATVSLQRITACNTKDELMALLDSMGVFNKDQPGQKLEKVTVDTNKQRVPVQSTEEEVKEVRK